MWQKFLGAALISSTLILPLAPTSTAVAAVAGRGPIVELNWKGKGICDAFSENGASYWSAKVRGRLQEDSGGFTDRFTVRTCFATAGQCNHFLDRIHQTVHGIEQIYYSRCLKKG